MVLYNFGFYHDLDGCRDWEKCNQPDVVPDKFQFYRVSDIHQTESAIDELAIGSISSIQQ